MLCLRRFRVHFRQRSGVGIGARGPFADPLDLFGQLRGLLFFQGEVPGGHFHGDPADPVYVYLHPGMGGIVVNFQFNVLRVRVQFHFFRGQIIPFHIARRHTGITEHEGRERGEVGIVPASRFGGKCNERVLPFRRGLHGLGISEVVLNIFPDAVHNVLVPAGAQRSGTGMRNDFFVGVINV